MPKELFTLKHPTVILSTAAVGGTMEGEGRFGNQFDMKDPTGKF